MTDCEIETIKRRGLKRSLYDAASSQLWEARRNLECAAHASPENFPSEVGKARKLIDDAEQLWEEAQKL